MEGLEGDDSMEGRGWRGQRRLKLRASCVGDSGGFGGDQRVSRVLTARDLVAAAVVAWRRVEENGG